ncbi:MAG: flagellar biosynthesis protein FlhF [Planctomycetaceae bacterium]|nr:flagellar biosynthesis protein FlhF [Planctomycetaceae bacterium]
MPDIKTFRAETMSEALDLVKQDLGSDALIMHTRQIPIKSLLPWQKGKTVTEIVAVLAEEEPVSSPQSMATAPAEQTARHIPQESRYENKSETKHELLRELTASRFAPDHSDRLRSNQASIEALKNQQMTQPPIQPKTVEANFVEATQKVYDQSESAKLEKLVTERLDALQKMIENLTQQVQAGASPNIPPELFEVYTELIDSDIEEELARELITRLRHRCSQEDLQNPDHIRSYLLGMVESQIKCQGAIQVTPGQQKVVALVGPTGVGKTTTIAKLAANFRLRDNIRMGLITVDTYRIAAVEQLRIYADIIDLPMKVVTSTREMKQAVEDLSEMDLILIDTAGRSPQDDLRIQELKSYLSEIVVDEVHLVLSATTGYRNLKKTVEKFSSVNPTAVIFTKLDEAPGLGSLVNVCGKLGHSLSYLTTGQNVPNDIEPADLTRTAKLVLGSEQVEI